MTVKRFVICFSYGMLGFFILAIADAIFEKVFSRMERTTTIHLLGLLFGSTVMCVIYVLFADRFSAGRCVSANTVLSKGQMFRLIATSLEAPDAGDQMGILIEAASDDVRYVYVDKEDEKFVPGYMYIYQGDNRIKLARIGKL